MSPKERDMSPKERDMSPKERDCHLSKVTCHLSEVTITSIVTLHMSSLLLTNEVVCAFIKVTTCKGTVSICSTMAFHNIMTAE